MLLDRWQEEGTVGRDERPALYAYRMTSPDGGSSTGVIGALGLGSPTKRPTSSPRRDAPTPRSDRLELLRATRANLSPSGCSAWQRAQRHLRRPGRSRRGRRRRRRRPPPALGARRPRRRGRGGRLVASAPVVVADGHHRYQTARTYQAERRAATNGAPGPYDQVMALVVELSEEQLDVGAIHRTIDHLPEGTDLPTLFGRYFDVVRAGDRSERVISALGESSSLALIDPRARGSSSRARRPTRRREAISTPPSSPWSSTTCRPARSPTATAPRRSSSPSRPARRKGRCCCGR